MRQNLGVILWQLYYGKMTLIVLVPEGFWPQRKNHFQVITMLGACYLGVLISSSVQCWERWHLNPQPFNCEVDTLAKTRIAQFCARNLHIVILTNQDA